MIMVRQVIRCYICIIIGTVLRCECVVMLGKWPQLLLYSVPDVIQNKWAKFER